MVTVPAMKFAQWLTANGLTPASYAKRRGWNRVRVARYAAGTRIPGNEAIRAIFEDSAGLVTANDFHDLPGGGIPPVDGDPANAPVSSHDYPAAGDAAAGAFGRELAPVLAGAGHD